MGTYHKRIDIEFEKSHCDVVKFLNSMIFKSLSTYLKTNDEESNIKINYNVRYDNTSWP